jgi:S-formylglutathione hydrolase FrmB
MGGFGAISLAMKHPDVFGAVYALSPCCLGIEGDMDRDNPAWRRALRMQSVDELKAQPNSFEEFFSIAFVALAAAASPNPAKPPLYMDLPFHLQDGVVVPREDANAKWRENMPLYLVERYRTNLSKLRGIYPDYGTLEEFSHIRLTTRSFSDELSRRGIPHTFEVYAEGTHEGRIRERLETRLFRFFSDVLSFPPK